MAPLRAGAGYCLPRQDARRVALPQSVRRVLERVVHARYIDEYTRACRVDRPQHWTGSGCDYTDIFRDAGDYGCGNNDDGVTAAALPWISTEECTRERNERSCRANRE